LPRSSAARASAARIFGRHTTEIIAGATPILTSVNPNSAVSTAMLMSSPAARPMPPATQWPAMRPTYGFGDRLKRRNRSVGAVGATAASGRDRAERSAPAQNTRPRLVSTTTRTDGSASASSSATTSSAVSSVLRTFRRSSSASVIVSTPPSSPVST
jgi:hypothetical protein